MSCCLGKISGRSVVQEVKQTTVKEWYPDPVHTVPPILSPPVLAPITTIPISEPVALVSYTKLLPCVKNGKPGVYVVGYYSDGTSRNLTDCLTGSFGVKI